MHLVVVGGGPVGLFSGVYAARRGVRVTVLEARRGDGDKACGEGLMPTGARLLKSIDVHPEGYEFRGVRYLDASGRRQARAFLEDARGLGVRRTELVRALRAANAREGVEIRTAKVVDVEPGGSAPSVVIEEGEVIAADVVLGCDGMASTVRKRLGLDAPVASGGIRHRASLPRYGLVSHYRVTPWSADVEVYWAAGAEAYVTPLASDLVGVAMLGGAGASFDERLVEFPALQHRLGGSERVGRITGAGPLRRRSVSAGLGQVMLVGDAAGYVDALTGEGLSTGFQSAVAAVDAAVAGDAASYPTEWRKLTRRSRLSTELLLRGTRVPLVRKSLLPASESASGAFGAIVRWVA